TGGRPLGAVGPIFWDLQIPVGSVNYSDGRMLADLLVESNSTKVRVQILALISEGHHRNIIADIPSASGTGEYLVIGAHYDTVLCEGFIDNSAGVATMLEVARTVRLAQGVGDLELRYGLRFIAFAGEELGLAGSINYVYAHQKEISSMVAVMVIDSIGSRSFKVTDAHSYRGIDLNDLVEDASGELGTNCTIENIGSSDHSSFMYPEQVAQNYIRYWREPLELRAVQGVPNSMLFYSTPITIYEGSSGTVRGHIHTQSDSRSGIGEWIDPDDLLEQAEMVALTTILSVSVEHVVHDNTWIYVVLILVVITAGISYHVFRN
ncbi:MAG: M28 family metallopeptidase, partial [Methanomassiliicoccales archaeon]|nr:M28 family metallopeptidase [Methanomassiliicoccales archaeon]